MDNEIFLEVFSRNLKQLRKDAGLSMDGFCEKFNAKFGTKLNKSTVSRYENAGQEPMVSLVKNLSEFFQVSPNYLLGDEHKENEPDMIAAHHAGETWSEEEQILIDQFKAALRMNRKS